MCELEQLQHSTTVIDSLRTLYTPRRTKAFADPPWMFDQAQRSFGKNIPVSCGLLAGSSVLITAQNAAEHASLGLQLHS